MSMSNLSVKPNSPFLGLIDHIKIDHTKLCIVDIPPEIRIAIYEYALAPTSYICTCKKSDINVHGNGCWCDFHPQKTDQDLGDWTDGQHMICRTENTQHQIHSRTSHPSLALALLRTTRLISEESLDVFLKSNIFILELLGGAQVTQLNIPAHTLETIERVFLVFDLEKYRFGSWDGAVATLQQMKALKHIRLTGFWDEPSQPFSGPFYVNPRTGRVLRPISSCGSQGLLAALYHNVPHFRNVAFGSATEAEKGFTKSRPPGLAYDVDFHEGDWAEARVVLLENDARDVLGVRQS